MALILDGVIQENTLKAIHKDKSWLKSQLSDKGLLASEVFYAFYKNKKIYIIKRCEVS